MVQSMAGKPDGESSGLRRLQVFGTIVGLVAFFLGVQNIGDLKQKLFPSLVFTSVTSSPPPQPSSRAGQGREAVKWQYVRNADAVCARTLTNVPGRITTINDAWMTRVLGAREQFMTAWTRVAWPAGSPVDEVYDNEVGKIWADFNEATAAWRLMRADLVARDRVQYNLDLATFLRAHDSFVNGANRFGFRSCNHAFPTTSSWT